MGSLYCQYATLRNSTTTYKNSFFIIGTLSAKLKIEKEHTYDSIELLWPTAVSFNKTCSDGTNEAFILSPFKINDEKEKNMKSVKMLAVASAIVAVASGSAMAFPTGQINIPSTDAKGLKEVTIGINNYAHFSSAEDAGTNTFGIGVTTGVLPFKKVKLEVGTDYTPSSTNPFNYNAKLATTEDAFVSGLPAFAVGVFALDTTDNSPNIVYALAAKTLPVVGRLSIGGYSGDKDALVDANGKKDNSGVLASWDRTISEVSDKLWLSVDYMSGKNGFGGIGFGGAWAYSKQVSLLVGATVYNEIAYSKPTFTTQVIINLP